MKVIDSLQWEFYSLLNDTGLVDNIYNFWSGRSYQDICLEGLLAQFPALPNVNLPHQSITSSSIKFQQTSEDESVHREGAEVEEVTECSCYAREVVSKIILANSHIMAMINYTLFFCTFVSFIRIFVEMLSDILCNERNRNCCADCRLRCQDEEI